MTIRLPRTLENLPPAEVRDHLVHEYMHHLDHSLGRRRPVSETTGSLIRAGLVAETRRLSALPESTRKDLHGRLKRDDDKFLADLFGALTLNKIGFGHSTNYYLADPERRFREAFAAIGTIYARPDRRSWALLSDLSPDLGKAFGRWLATM